MQCVERVLSTWVKILAHTVLWVKMASMYTGLDLHNFKGLATKKKLFFKLEKRIREENVATKLEGGGGGLSDRANTKIAFQKKRTKCPLERSKYPQKEETETQTKKTDKQ